MPADRKAFKLHCRYQETVYPIAVAQTDAAEQRSGMRVTVDGVERHDKIIPLIDDRQDHAVEVRIMALPR